MKPNQQCLCLALAGLLAIMPAMAQRITGTAVAAPGRTGTLTPHARGELARQFVLKWGAYVQRVYRTDVRAWSQRMVSSFVQADADNLRSALARTTFEGAMATLDGAGGKLSDARVIDAIARNAPAASGAAAAPAMLGDTAQDLVYTQLTPCRIVDTRLAGGMVAARVPRGFVGWVATGGSFAAQGGSASDCGLGGESPEVLVVTLTAVAPALSGYATLYPASLPLPPQAATMVYQGWLTSSVGTSVTLGTADGADFKLFSEDSMHFGIDMAGYFDAPHATPVQCTETFVSQAVAADATFDIPIPGCPAGYALTGAGCRTPGFRDAQWAINGLFRQSPGVMLGFCSGANVTAGTITVHGTAQCCRIPGR